MTKPDDGLPEARSEASSDAGWSETVTFAIATMGYLPFVLNLHASLVRLGLGAELVVYSLDDEAHVALQREGIRSIRAGNASTPHLSVWGTPSFARTMAFKYEVALTILQSGKDALYLDTDIVVLRNPFGYLRRALADSSADLAMQVQEPDFGFNAGFWFARARPAVVSLFDRLRQECAKGRDDQNLLNEWLPRDHSVSVLPLDAELFACGNQFLDGPLVEQGGYCIDRSLRPFPYEAAYLLHFNYLIGDEAKVWAMARHGALFHPRLASKTKGVLVRARRWIRRVWSGR